MKAKAYVWMKSYEDQYGFHTEGGAYIEGDSTIELSASAKLAEGLSKAQGNAHGLAKGLEKAALEYSKRLIHNDGLVKLIE